MREQQIKCGQKETIYKNTKTPRRRIPRRAEVVFEENAAAMILFLLSLNPRL